MVTTQCSGNRFEFGGLGGGRTVVAGFDGGTITSDAGLLLLAETDSKMKLIQRLSACFHDGRNQEKITHGLEQMLAQRIFGLAAGYEDVNDHDQLRHDPLLAAVVGSEDIGQPLAGKSTLNRLELTPAGADADSRHQKIVARHGELKQSFVRRDLYRSTRDLYRAPVDIFIEQHETPPREIVLDPDATDDGRGRMNARRAE